MKFKKIIILCLTALLFVSDAPINNSAEDEIDIEEENEWIEYEDIDQEEDEEIEQIEYEDIDQEEEDEQIEYEDIELETELPSAYPISYSDNQLKYFSENYPPIRNQSPYGTCQAHSAIASAEFYAITHEIADKNIDYSEAQFIYWAFTTLPIGPIENKDEVINGNLKMDSGTCPSDIINTLSHGVGPIPESIIPYSNLPSFVNGEKLPDDTAIKHEFLLDSAYQLKDINKIKNHIINNGAVNAEMLFNAQYSNPKKGGAYYCTDSTDFLRTNHMLVIVGQDDNYPKENFSQRYNSFEQKYYGGTPNQNGAWLARNSSSDETKEDLSSYFQISYESTQLNFIGLNYSTDLTYDKEYTYNQLGEITDNAINASTYMNIFTIENDCKLGQISFLTGPFNKVSDYIIKIYKINDFDINNISNMTPIQTIEGTTREGVEYYKISIDPILLKSNDQIVVSIEFLNTSGHIMTEFNVSSLKGFEIKYHAAPNQSYIYNNKQIDIGELYDINNLISLQVTKDIY